MAIGNMENCTVHVFKLPFPSKILSTSLIILSFMGQLSLLYFDSRFYSVMIHECTYVFFAKIL